MHGINIDDAKKHSMSCDMSCIDLRDKGGLIWPSKLIVMLSGSIIKIFERFIQSENLMNDYYASCSSSRVALLALKNLLNDLMSESLFFNAFKGKCRLCGIDMMKKLINPLTITFFNVTTNNFTILLNRREVARKLTMKLVKALKKKNRCANKEKCKNDYSDVSTWTCEFCKDMLKSHGALQQGNKKELIDRCVLLKHLIANDIEHLMSASKTDLKSMSNALSLPCGLGVSKDDMITNVSNVMLDMFGDTSNGVLALIEEEERNEVDI